MDEELRKLHQAQLFILRKFDQICRDNNISYFLDSGSALGAIRHGGFIPWDDDVDVGLIRTEYDKLMKVLSTTNIEPLYLLTRKQEKLYRKYNAKLMLLGSEMPEKDNVNWKFKGIYIDLFPFDNAGKTEKESRRSVKTSNAFLHFLHMRQKGLSQSNILRSLLALPTCIIPLSLYEKLYNKYCTRFSEETDGYYACYSYRMIKHKMLLFDFNTLFPSKDIMFEGEKCMIMNDPDQYLSTMYNRYMELPKEEDRIHHVNGHITFPDYLDL